MSFKKEYEVRLEDLGKGNAATDVAIMKMLEEIAERNSYEVGFGLENLAETNKAWLLLDWKVEIIKRPKYKENVSIETWSTKMERCYGYRDFEVYNKEKELIARGTSKWVMIDIEKRRPIRINEEDAAKYAVYDKGYSVFEDDIAKMDEMSEDELKFVKKYEVQRRDIDVNQHMNNIAYLELAYEALPYDVYDENEFKNVRITYKKEVKYGDIVNCYYTNKDNKHIITIMSEEFLEENAESSKKVNAIVELY